MSGFYFNYCAKVDLFFKIVEAQYNVFPGRKYWGSPFANSGEPSVVRMPYNSSPVRKYCGSLDRPQEITYSIAAPGDTARSAGAKEFRFSFCGAFGSVGRWRRFEKAPVRFCQLPLSNL